MANNFIEQKSQQLVFYATGFLQGTVPHTELHLFIWDTLEEWAAISEPMAPPLYQESVFWYLVHQLEYWPEQQLRHNKKLKRDLTLCLSFLSGKGQRPIHCVGLRPC